MANLGNLFYSVYLKDMTDADKEKIRKKVEGMTAKMGVTVSPSAVQKAMKNALKGQTFKARVNMVVDKANVQDAIRQAFAQAGLRYDTTASDVRQNRIDTNNLRTNAYIDAQKALERLRIAREQATLAADRHNTSLSRVSTTMSSQSRISGQLRNEILNVFSVYAVQRFLTSLISIGGEFQKQHIALSAILKDAAKADVLFGKIKELAVASPYNFKDLASYTKQIAAFSIPYEELYDTTKRLADISAGLGVDMGRIILAYGQVRSAAFLRGQEVRQFTEAGIPLLDKLAEKFTMLEGRVVSVGEVFDKISKRQVSFQMVKDVLWDLTNEGGQFYNMQEELTESLSGKLEKLKDSFQIMLADIAEANNSLLGGSIDSLTKLMGHWREMANIIGSLIAAYGSYRATIMAINAIQAALIVQKYGLAKATRARILAFLEYHAIQGKVNAGLVTMLRNLGNLKKAFAAIGRVGWVGIVMGALAAVTTYLISASIGANRLKNELDDIANKGVSSAQNEIDGYKILVEKLRNVVKGSQEYNDIIEKIQSRYGEYLGNVRAEADAYSYLKGKIDDVTASLRNKAMEQARQQGVSKITESYSEEKQSEFSESISSLQKNFRLSKEAATQLASLIQADISNGMAAGLSQGYEKAVDYIKSKAEEIGIAIKEPGGPLITQKGKYGKNVVAGGASESIKHLKALSELTTSESYAISEYTSNLEALSGMTTVYGLKIEKLEKQYEREKANIPIDATSRLKQLYLDLLDAKEKIYKDYGQEGEIRKLEVERASIAQQVENWRSLSKEKTAAYSFLQPKDDEDAISYISRLQKEYKELQETISQSDGKVMLQDIADNAKPQVEIIKTVLQLLGQPLAELKSDSLIEKRRNELEKLSESLLSLLMKNQEDEISLMKDGTDKKLKQIDIDYEKQRHEIEKKEREFSRSNKKAGVGGLDSSGLTDEQRKEIDKAVRLNEERRLKRKKEAYQLEVDAMLDFLKEYGSLEQKKLAITEFYENKIAKAGTKGEKLSLIEQKKAELSKLSFENISMGLDWKALFSGVDSLSKEMIKPIMEQLVSYSRTDDYKNSDSQTQRDIAELIQELRSYLGTDKSMTWQALETAIKDFTVSVDAYNTAVENEKRAVAKRAQAKLKLDKGEITQKEYDAIAQNADDFGKATVEARKSMNGFASVLNDTSEQVKNHVSKLSAALNNAILWKGVDGFGDLRQSIGNIDELKGSIDSVLPSMADGIGKNISESLSSSVGSGLSVMGDGLSKILSSGLGQAIGIVAQIPKLILDVVSSIKNFVTGVLDSVSELVSFKWLDDLVTGILNSVENLIDTIFDLPENLYKVFEGIVVDGVGGLLNTVLGRVGNILTFGLLSSGGPADWFTNSNAEEVAETTERLTDSNERLKDAVDSLKDEMSKSGGWKAINATKQAKEDQKKINDQTMQILQAQMGYHGAHHSNAYYWRLGLEDYASLNKTLADYKKKNPLAETKTDSVYSLSDIYKLTPEQMNYIRTYNIEMWEKMLDQGKYDKSEYWDDYADLAGELEEITGALKETLTQTSFDSLRDSFIDALLDMDASAEDFAADFSEYMMKSILNAKIADLLDDELQKFYDKWAEYAESGNEITDAEQKALNDMWNALVQKGIDIRDQVSEFTGYTGGDKESSSGLSKSIQSNISEDTVNLMASYINAMRSDLSVVRSIIERKYGEVGFNYSVYMSDIITVLSSHSSLLETNNILASAQLQQLTMIAINTGRTANSNDKILEAVSELRDDVHGAKVDKNRGWHIQ